MSNEMININDMISETSVYTSLKCDTDAEKVNFYNITNAPQERLGDHINEVINAKDIFCESVECVNDETGEITNAPRIVIIDDKGVGYACVSMGVFSSLKKIMNLFGQPTWEKPVKIKVGQIKKSAKSILTLTLV